MNIVGTCIQCKCLVPDYWLFEAVDQQDRDCWVCGTCAGLEEE